MRGLQYLIIRYLLRRSHLLAKCNYFGARFKCKTEDVIGRHLFKKGVHEKENTDYIIKHIKLEDGELALDIGANIGWFSVLLSKLASDEARIFAFEPEPSNFELLEHNLKQNECANVVAVNKGVSDKDGVMSLYLHPDKNRGRHSLIPDSSLRKIEVDIVSLDSFFNATPPGKIRFLKIDIEGYEYFAFKGAQKLLAHVPMILMEYSPHLYNIGFTNDDLLDTLMDLSFRPHLMSSEDIVEVDRKTLLDRQDQFDIFWMK